MIAKRYEAALLTVDGVVLEALSNGNTPAGLRARELCAEAAARRAEELRAMEGDDPEKKTAGGLSVEAVTAHTQGTGQCQFYCYFLNTFNVWCIMCNLVDIDNEMDYGVIIVLIFMTAE